MAAITDISDLINRQSGGNSGTPNNLFFHKVPRVAGAAAATTISGRGASLWTYDGMPAGGATPTAVAIPDRSLQGALPFLVATGGRDTHLIGASITPTSPGVWMLYDRLMHIGGLSGTSTADQDVQDEPPSVSITRNTGGDGNIAWYEIYSVVGTVSTTLTMTYTNQSGTSGRTSTINIGATNFREISRAQRIPLAAGDTGIRSIEKVKLTATTGTAGSFGITLAQPIASIPVGSGGTAGWRDYTTGLPGIPVIDPNACLAWFFIPNGTVSPEFLGCLATIEK